MTAKHKYENVQITVRKRWEVPTGHKEDRCYNSCTMDNQPKRLRTRSARNKFAMRDYE